MGASWYRRIEKWLQRDAAETLEVGKRSLNWVEGMYEDLQRWKFPVTIVCQSNTLNRSSYVSVSLKRVVRKEVDGKGSKTDDEQAA